MNSTHDKQIHIHSQRLLVSKRLMNQRQVARSELYRAICKLHDLLEPVDPSAVDMLKAAVGTIPPPTYSSSHIPSVVVIGGAPQQTVVINNVVGIDDEKPKKKKEEESQVGNNIATGAAILGIAGIGAAVVGSLYKSSTQVTAIHLAFGELMQKVEAYGAYYPINTADSLNKYYIWSHKTQVSRRDAYWKTILIIGGTAAIVLGSRFGHSSLAWMGLCIDTVDLAWITFDLFAHNDNGKKNFVDSIKTLRDYIYCTE